MTTQSSLSFGDLPVEMILHLTSFLEHSDLANVRLTNHRQADIQSENHFFDRVYARPLSSFLKFVKDTKRTFPNHPLVTGTFGELTLSVGEFEAIRASTPPSSDNCELLEHLCCEKTKTLMLYAKLNVAESGDALQSCLTFMKPDTLILNYLDSAATPLLDPMPILPSLRVKSLFVILPFEKEAIGQLSYTGTVLARMMGTTYNLKSSEVELHPLVDSATVLLIDRSDKETPASKMPNLADCKHFITFLHTCNSCPSLKVRSANLRGSTHTDVHNDWRGWLEEQNFRPLMPKNPPEGFRPDTYANLTFDTTIGEHDVPRMARYSVNSYINGTLRSGVDPDATTSDD